MCPSLDQGQGKITTSNQNAYSDNKALLNDVKVNYLLTFNLTFMLAKDSFWDFVNARV